ncbi:hypothetical protein ABE288_03535 [Bacillus salipaludis]|uniref:hypothetical protein n=1 Tax=Bacillus salipaludis TaxID=2547811 RepID=UPI003D260912
MSIIFTNLLNEIVPIVMYEGSEDYKGLVILKSRDKTIINRNSGHLYIDLKSFAHELALTENQLLDFISYNASVRGNLAFYRDKNYRVVKVLDLNGLNDLIRHLRGLGIDSELLKGVKEKVNKMLEKIEEKEAKEHGEN